MRNKRALALVIVLLIIVAGVFLFVSRFNLSALPEPGTRETILATRAKRLLIGRAARASSAPGGAAKLATGRMIFMGECSVCHGNDGRTPSNAGRWMYPRTPDLGSKEVQEWSDPELHWIIKHGVRFSGMPGFGKVYNDEQLWQLVHYVRSLAAATPNPAEQH
jgi:mono/diheme cytochrome c family protein